VFRDVTRRHNAEKRPLAERDAYGQAFLQTLNLRFVSEEVSSFVLASRFGRIAAELLGTDAVRIFHDQTLFKEPGGGLTPWHQDQYYWPIEGQSAVSFWIPLVDCPVAMGALRFAVGSHREGYFGDHAISKDSQAAYERLIADRRFSVACHALALGDVSVHLGWTIHGAGANQTGVTREAVAISYYADGARVAVPRNPSQEHDRIAFLDGRAPGALADGPANTVVWRRVP
jgi:ectoine hydroxylase-related dioxygenase (phytanoyl-CoA dioxygenase family)